MENTISKETLNAVENFKKVKNLENELRKVRSEFRKDFVNIPEDEVDFFNNSVEKYYDDHQLQVTNSDG